jgi:hypothetical protein
VNAQQLLFGIVMGVKMALIGIPDGFTEAVRKVDL